jgi:hypothetical protein
MGDDDVSIAFASEVPPDRNDVDDESCHDNDCHDAAISRRRQRR